MDEGEDGSRRRDDAWPLRLGVDGMAHGPSCQAQILRVFHGFRNLLMNPGLKHLRETDGVW
jgi:hypothetical protein